MLFFPPFPLPVLCRVEALPAVLFCMKIQLAFIAAILLIPMLIGEGLPALFAVSLPVIACAFFSCITVIVITVIVSRCSSFPLPGAGGSSGCLPKAYRVAPPVVFLKRVFARAVYVQYAGIVKLCELLF